MRSAHVAAKHEHRARGVVDAAIRLEGAVECHGGCRALSATAAAQHSTAVFLLAVALAALAALATLTAAVAARLAV